MYSYTIRDSFVAGTTEGGGQDKEASFAETLSKIKDLSHPCRAVQVPALHYTLWSA